MNTTTRPLGPADALIAAERADDDIDFSPPTPMPLAQAAESALHLIRLAEGDLASIKRGKAARAAHALVQHVGDDLERAIAAHSDAATRELREIVLTALGPELTYGEVVGACRALRMVLECLDLPEPSIDDGDAA
jgi:hypothetical protein